MRLIPRHRQHQRVKVPRIAFSHEEIAADLHYPATRNRAAKQRGPAQASPEGRR